MILQALYFMLPAYIANMAPVIARGWIKPLCKPVDGGKGIFGNNKTYNGFFFGVLFALGVTFIQSILYNMVFFREISLVNYNYWFIVGFLLGFGALFGDLIKSFFKRRIGIAPGSRFFPWDQLDFVFGALIFSSLIVKLTFSMMLVIAIVSVLGHIAVNHTAYYLRIRKEKW
ncbi:MAG TPA: CDP-archaeol synthase [Candidatus Nanoarchaeia archaeon]|nr:CDP-archaeol synthase [Candidatus Nanoarchaeia archaeon]